MLVAIGAAAPSTVLHAQTTAPVTELPPVNVIAPSPLAGTRSARPAARPAVRSTRTARTRTAPAAPAAAPEGGTAAPGPSDRDSSLIDRDKVPSNTEVLTSQDFSSNYSTNFLDSVNRKLPGVTLGDHTGNPFQRNLDYRGFTASPVQGTPQGLAVYQNGVRINESWGDVVNWDFIPEKAIDRVSLFPNNPVFGLNAIGGALSIQMKNGFTYQGVEGELFGGSYGRVQSSVQAGGQKDNVSAYAAFESAYDRGWRDYANSSHVNRMYVDVGARNDQTEFHVNFTGADNILGNVAATPIQMLNQRWSSVYTWPQTTHLQLAFVNATLNHNFSDTWSFQGNAYFRGFRQSHVDGNGTDVESCNRGRNLCLDGAQDNMPIFGTTPVPNTLGTAFLGEIDRNTAATNSYGGTAQVTGSDKLFGHDNHVVMGVSVDHGYTKFNATSELGTIDPNNLFVTGTGIFVNQPDAGLAPVDLHATNTYTGVYLTDTFDVTNKFAVTAGGRFNLAQIDLQDQTGTNPLLNSNNRFQRLNPVIGGTYKITPNLTVYAGYSEANRAPTPLELGCSDPARPCVIDSFLIADPPLKQVVAHTVEAGIRGGWGRDARTGVLSWGLGGFRTLSDDDIIRVTSPLGTGNFGYFQNAGQTLRQGIEAKLEYRVDRWNAYANYTFIDATFQSANTLPSPNNPNAITDPASGSQFINVKPGDHIPGIPAHRFKAGVEYQASDAWKIGADVNVVGSQWLIGDDTNQSPKVPAYAVLNLHTSYKITENVEVFGLINNVFNQHYYLGGAFFEPGGFASTTRGVTNLMAQLTDPRTFVPGMPLAAYAGIRAKF
ncbi:Vitamin B12 transporter BtuB [Bradyrhizobium ivorense]|uniref:Vitamin B12 transporter BtuB n=1 Tax=Bradyrhizobium ivorense TaxID=2511166 RepID=A0A508TL66_9BRAD|nr:TonB-dependent receptor [Bradyrhizobium ivorense]VIO74996.1 Vitamin B12 transporter BtuB [Bradyrhizobium ivorense]